MDVGNRELSELECFALGLIWQFGPCSPYDVRQHLRNSPSTQWSGSAGAIYPLVRRLERRGLLISKTESTGRRRRRMYRLTRPGLDALRRWIGPPLAEEAISAVYDPLRSRARYLGLLKPKDRQRWIEAARDALQVVEDAIADWDETYRDSGDEFLRATTRHGRLDVLARRQWLDELTRIAARADDAKS